MKAIETLYAGCRFRSRLEARWAVFFDALGWRWEHEPEGIAVDHGYLPDFRVWGPGTPNDVRHEETYFEVKAPPVVDAAFRFTIQRVIEVLDGAPRRENPTGYPIHAGTSGSGPYLIGNSTDPAFSPLTKPIAFAAHRSIYVVGELAVEAPFLQLFEQDTLICIEPHNGLGFFASAEHALKATTRARSARFERGETPLRARESPADIARRELREALAK